MFYQCSENKGDTLCLWFLHMQKAGVLMIRLLKVDTDDEVLLFLLVQWKCIFQN